MDNKENELLRIEQKMLREELQSLKECQIRYFSLSVTTSGLIIGVASKLSSSNSPSLLYIAPLIIVLPCWLIFFDKATTITRIVGYLRILEFSTLSPTNQTYVHIGWENALCLFREEQDKKEKPVSLLQRFKFYLLDAAKGIRLLLFVTVTHRYWIINWLIFFVIAILCWILGLGSDAPHFVLSLVFGFFVLICSIHNLYILRNLINGKFSYNSKEEIWKKILSSKKAHNYLSNKYKPKQEMGSISEPHEKKGSGLGL